MGQNGGGYTFLSARAMAELSNSDLQTLHTDNSSFLMRVKFSNGTQRYGVLSQLPQFASVSAYHTSLVFFAQ